MSDFVNKLHLVIRRPQEGKTYICISKIISEPGYVHIIATMNTLSAGMQFFGRLQEHIGSEHILVLNSDKSTAGECHHAKNIDEVKKILKKEQIKVIICCAHNVRLKHTILSLLTECMDSIALKTVLFKLHIDEAHEYIKTYNEAVRKINNMINIHQIIGYSASPIPIWDPKGQDPLYGYFTISDPEKELGIMSSKEYFGVKDAAWRIYDDIPHSQLIEQANIPIDVPDFIQQRSFGETEKKRKWYTEKFPFQLGNEYLLLSFVDFVLRTELQKTYAQDAFSKHFLPAYTSKVTHYGIVELFLKYFPKGNAIVFNGNGIELYRINNETSRSYLVRKFVSGYLIVADKKDKSKREIEPSKIIQTLIQGYSQFPTGITGLICVSMSMTLTDQESGNFDTCTFAHQQLNPEQLYQLCRFCFNYEHWKPENKAKIKQTQLLLLTKDVLDTCLNYEEQIEKMCEDFQGKDVSLNQVLGKEAYVPTKRELKSKAYIELEKFVINPENKRWKRFTVHSEMDEGERTDVWKQVSKFYEGVRGIPLRGQAMPKSDGKFYICTLSSGGVGIQKLVDIEQIRNGKDGWNSRFCLQPGQLNYARVFVGYNNENDPTEYTIYVKYVQLTDCLEVHSIFEKFFLEDE